MSMPAGAEAASLADEPGARFSTWLGALLVTLALASALVTFLVISGSTPIEPVHRVVVGLFLANAVIILALLALVAVRAFLLFRDRWRGLAGASLHVRILLLFSFIAAVPPILLAVIALVTLERGLEPWFSDRMRNVIFKSVDVADAYTRSQCVTLGRESRLLTDDLTRVRQVLEGNRDLLDGFLTARATALGLPVVKLITRAGDPIHRARLNVIEDPPNPPADVFDDARNTGDPICSGDAQTRVFSAVSSVPGFGEAYLLIARQVEAIAVEFPEQARAAAVEYLNIDARRRGIQIAFGAMYALISLTVLLSAIWFGLSFANTLVKPIRRLIGATDEVASGNYAVQVPVRKSDGDLGHLGQTFNKMTAELRRQRDGLVSASDVLDRRRRFTETVLAGVSAGVVGVDQAGNVTLLNRVAEELLGVDRRTVGKPFATMAPELAGVVGEARVNRQRTTTAQIALMRSGRERNLNVRVSREGDARQQGLVVTIDDISELVAAQRTSAWADVARRIAHEIKNPLTPIQLSAERIKRKFGRVIVEDKDILDQCTDTIVRQVEDIRQMVDEFSSFARMPKPQPVNDDLAETVREVAFLMRVGNPDISIEATGADGGARAVFDRRLIAQALTNVVKNATEAIQAVHGIGPGTGGKVRIALAEHDGGWAIDVTDNGKGFPRENRQRLLEPYMTTREGGTGLGLAIVGKILEDHGGSIALLDRADGERGATVRLWLPAAPDPGRKPGTTKTDTTEQPTAAT